DLSRSTGATGTSSLPSASDPTQFVDYLRAVSSATSSKGLTVIRGVQSAHYHAVVDLDRYPKLVSAAKRPAVLRSVKAFETTLGSHMLPVDVWVDVHSLVRRIRVDFQQCVARSRFTFSMTLDLY